MTIKTLRPNGAGNATLISGQLPGAGAHWDKVDDVRPDWNTTYVVQTMAAQQYDRYAVPAYTGVGTINKVTVYAAVASTNTQGMCTVIRTHSTNYYGSAQGNTGWTVINTEYTTNPNTGFAWTWAEIDAMEAGVRLYPIPPAGDFCTQVYAVVNYGTPSNLSGQVPRRARV